MQRWIKTNSKTLKLKPFYETMVRVIARMQLRIIARMNRTSLNSGARGLEQIWGCECTRESSFVNIGTGAAVEYAVGETKRLPGIINNAEHHYSGNFYLLGRALMNIMTYSFLSRST